MNNREKIANKYFGFQVANIVAGTVEQHQKAQRVLREESLEFADQILALFDNTELYEALKEARDTLAMEGYEASHPAIDTVDKALANKPKGLPKVEGK